MRDFGVMFDSKLYFHELSGYSFPRNEEPWRYFQNNEGIFLSTSMPQEFRKHMPEVTGVRFDRLKNCIRKSDCVVLERVARTQRVYCFIALFPA